MIKLVEWLLGLTPPLPPTAPLRVDPRLLELDAQREEAEQHREEARELRVEAERIGPETRRRLRQNHFGEGMKEALHQRGWIQA